MHVPSVDGLTLDVALVPTLECLLTYLHTYTLTHLLTYSLTHLLAYSLTHSLTYSLTHSFTDVTQAVSTRALRD